MLLLLVRDGACQGRGKEQLFNVLEEQNVGTIIGTIGTGIAGADPGFTVLSNPNGGVETDLDINEATGLIRTKVKLDREARKYYTFIAMSDTTGVALKIIIHVLDTNDHSPTFPESIVNITLSESTPRDTKQALGSAVDPDLGINTTQRYEITEGNVNNAFRLRSKRASNGILYLDLEVNGVLDYEKTPFYMLVIKAYDGGSPPKWGSMKVNITIIDTNDNQPIFNQSRYFARVYENATVGTSVIQVQATDRDNGENGKLRYHIDQGRSEAENRFEVNPETGIVFVNKPLDYEKKNSYEVIVVAKDNGTQPLQTTAIVSISVLDINDNEPKIDLIFLTKDGTDTISENSKPGDYVARISVSDPDVSGYLSKVNVTLTGGDGHFGLTTRDNVVYLVLLKISLDRENKSYFTLTITATDSGTPPLQAIKTFQLKVSDNNDNAPTFSQKIYYADIQEVVPPGSSVIQLSAVDRDEGNNSVITYRIIHTPKTHSDWFTIDDRTGLVTTKSRVDCETASEPRLTVVATDSGQPPLSTNTTVIIRIRDVNDNQPVFDQSFYNVSIPESEAVGRCVLKVGWAFFLVGGQTRGPL